MPERARSPFDNRWDLAVVALCSRGVQRFDDLQRQLGISRKVLAERLRSLQHERILERHRYQCRPERFDYQLTTKGRALLPVLEAMEQWSRRWQDPTAPE